MDKNTTKTIKEIIEKLDTLNFDADVQKDKLNNIKRSLKTNTNEEILETLEEAQEHLDNATSELQWAIDNLESVLNMAKN